MRARCAIVPRGEGERGRKKLSDAGLLRKDLAIRSDESSVYLPVLDGPELPFSEGKGDFEPVELRVRSYKELAKIPDDLRAELPTSFDIVGDVAVFKLQEELVPYARAIGRAILEANKGLRTAALDEGVGGEMRVRRLQVVAGRGATLTTHREYGVELRVDPALVYFSPRLAGERWRIAALVEDGERVIDMFAGVGPFSILIARRGRPKVVHAIDINPHAVDFLRYNIKRNKATCVEAHLGDSRKVAPGLGRADRILMNLPHSAREFLDVAGECAAPGAWVHVYQVVDKGCEVARAGELERLQPQARCHSWRVVHPYSPGSSVIAYDLKMG